MLTKLEELKILVEHSKKGFVTAAHFCKSDGSPITSVEDVIETTTLSAKEGGPFL